MCEKSVLFSAFIFFFLQAQTVQAAAATLEPEVVQGSLAIKRLAQVWICTSNTHKEQNCTEASTVKCIFWKNKLAFISVGPLSQHYLGEAAVILPEVYRHSFVAQGELEPIVRLCLLDPSFPALVEKVEGELRKLREE